MRYIIYPYKIGSASAKALAEALGGIRVRQDGRYRFRAGDRIINWGNSHVPTWFRTDLDMLNNPVSVANASNKLRTFEILSDAGIPTVPFTTEIDEALEWNQTVRVYARHKLTGHSGEGIEISEVDTAIPSAPLYTKEIENNGEYRVHVFNGEVIDYRKKSRQYDDEPTEEQSLVRTHGNGWIFRREHLKRLERIEDLAILAVAALGLDFGAVDIIKDENGDVFVVEVNTAVATEGETLTSYLEAITRYFDATTS
jgi:glutathione synthase/RimK-type ligase-like ATP-grasp enzyme